jgi:peroxiredoxin (alkyl hydroperoxide reductase subunit C)
MSIQVLSAAPPFKTQALVGQDFKTIALSDYSGRWVLLLFYPMDFTFICPTELVALSDRHEEFAARDCVVLAASTDTVYSHLGWTRADARLANLQFPLLADVTKSMARSYGVLREEQGISLRGTFLIDPSGVLRWASIHDDPVGRSVDEMIRVLDALQTAKLCPCNWKKGQPTL